MNDKAHLVLSDTPPAEKTQTDLTFEELAVTTGFDPAEFEPSTELVAAAETGEPLPSQLDVGE